MEKRQDLISRQAAINMFEPWLDVEGYSDGERNAIGVVVNELKDLPSAQQWIPCSERMPQTNVSILYCTTTGTVGEGRYEGYNGIHEVWKMYAICGTHWDDEVIAWMPLPEPYQEDEA